MGPSKTKIRKYAQILAFLEVSQGVENVPALIPDDPELKYLLKRLIRTATEDNNNHASCNYRSACARKFISEKLTDVKPSRAAYHAFCSQHLRHEHIVPIEETYRIFTNSKAKARALLIPQLNGKSGEEFYAAALEFFGSRATILKDEDARLNSSGFKSKMPEIFYNSKTELYSNTKARYHCVGIELEEFNFPE